VVPVPLTAGVAAGAAMENLAVPSLIVAAAPIGGAASTNAEGGRPPMVSASAALSA